MNHFLRTNNSLKTSIFLIIYLATLDIILYIIKKGQGFKCANSSINPLKE